jgi:hypothetical protein
MFYDNLNERSQETIQKAEFYLCARTSRKAILLMADGVFKGRTHYLHLHLIYYSAPRRAVQTGASVHALTLFHGRVFLLARLNTEL